MTDTPKFPTNYLSTNIFLLFVALYLFLQLFRLPLTPILFEGDHSVHISNAWRMFTGESAFRDFFLVTFPGTETYYLTLFEIFGVHYWLLNATIFFLLLGLSVLGLYLSKKLLTGWAVYLPTAIFLVFGFRSLGIDGSHRFFSVLAVLAAVAVIFSQRTLARLALAGTLCGIASIFTQPRGLAALAAIVLFLIVEKFYSNQDFKLLVKSVLCAAVPFGLIVAAVMLYFIAAAGFDKFYFATFVFPVKHYPADQWNNFGAYLREFPPFGSFSLFGYFKLTAPIFFFYLLNPAIYLIFAIVFWLKRKQIADHTKLPLILLNLVGFFLALGIFSAPSAIRLYQVSIPALISLVWILQTLVPRRQIPFAVILICSGLLGLSYSIQRQTTPVSKLATPTGTIAFLSEENMLRYQWAAENTAPLDYFYEPHHPSLYAVFKLKNATQMSWLRPNNFTTDQQVSDVIEDLRRHSPRYIMWNGAWTDIAENAPPDFHLQPLVEYMRSNYHLSEKFVNFNDVKGKVEYKIEVWEKNQ